MKKRLIRTLFTVVLCMELSACGKGLIPTNPVLTEITSAVEVQESEHIVLGGEFDTDYDGFTYLYCEELMTEPTENTETGKMSKQNLPVFIPSGDYVSVNRDTAYSEAFGVDFRISLNPYIRYDDKDYLLSENLKYYLEKEYDAFFCTDYFDIRISDIETVSNGARAYVSYCYYDKWDNKYIPVLATYYLTELSNDLTVLVEVKIDDEDVTGKTPALLSELENFYEFDIEWNEQTAKNILEQFLESSDLSKKSFSTGYLLFDLPSEWDRDYNNEDGSEYIFAPYGDAAFAGCMLRINREYLGSEAFDISDLFLTQENIDEYKGYLQEILGDTIYNIDIMYLGETCLGNAIKVTYQTLDEGYEDKSAWYTITDEDYVYTLEAVALPDCQTDVFALAENILLNGVKNR